MLESLRRNIENIEIYLRTIILNFINHLIFLIMISLVKKYKNNVKTFRLKKLRIIEGTLFILIKIKFLKKFDFQYYSFNKKIGTFRGFHYQTKFKQNKILYVHKGKILDVLVDIKTKNTKQNNFKF